MSQKYITTQREKKSNIYQNLLSKKGKSPIQFNRVNTENPLPGNYTFIKEYIQSRDNNEGKGYLIDFNNIVHYPKKETLNLKKKILKLKLIMNQMKIKKEKLKKLNVGLHLLINIQMIDTINMLKIIIKIRRVFKIVLI